tara:strand:- start:1281 stop:1754 length:474 start_codon:yes stop_codon:yes gene_type:complete
MNNQDNIIRNECIKWKKDGNRLVFTNGCFDLLHTGHKDLLATALSYGDILIVGLNSDTSVKLIKGEERPIQDQQIRKDALINSGFIKRVYTFNNMTPLNLIRLIKPDVLVKGGDYKLEDIIGAEDVISWGGEVKIIPITPGFSTTSSIKKLKRQGLV